MKNFQLTQNFLITSLIKITLKKNASKPDKTLLMQTKEKNGLIGLVSMESHLKPEHLQTPRRERSQKDF